MRLSAEPKRFSAIDLARCVFPTPVGPKNRKVPTGLDGSFIPAGVEKNCFSDPEICNRIHTNLKTGIIKFGPKSGEEDITVKFGGGGKPDVGNCFVTWSKSEQEPYYCVEPWMSLPNSASEPKHFVEPRSQKSFWVEISLI